MKNLRKPKETLAGCVWLARFVDKARCHLANELEPEYERVFAHPKATDGTFLKFFNIEKDTILEVINRSNGDDSVVEQWFLEQQTVSEEEIAKWNEIGPNLGKEGYPMREAFLFAKKKYFSGDPASFPFDNVFDAIAYDERD